MTIPVVMCTWQRIERLSKTLELLSHQEFRDFRLFLWNNNPEYVSLIERLVALRDWSYPIEVHHSPENVGGFGRFEYCRMLLPSRDYSHVVFIDDDQEFSPEMLSGFVREAAPRTISSRWSYRFKPGCSYWDRVRSHRGEPAHYCGTCGMITDISLFEDERLFDGCPERFHFIEDVWLSYHAQHVLDWKLVSSAVRVRTIADEKDTYLTLRERKVEFLEYLRGLGWQV